MISRFTVISNIILSFYKAASGIRGDILDVKHKIYLYIFMDSIYHERAFIKIAKYIFIQKLTKIHNLLDIKLVNQITFTK